MNNELLEKDEKLTEVIMQKCNLCGATLEYCNGKKNTDKTDFYGCPNYLKCGHKPLSLSLAVFLLKRHVQKLEDYIQNG